MTTTAPSVRTLTKQAIAAALTASSTLTGIQINYAQPKTPQNERISFSSLRGQMDGLAMTAGGLLSYLDSFTITLMAVSAVPSVDDGATADARVEAIVGALIQVLCDLNLTNTVPGLLDVALGVYNGPSPFPTDEGYASYATVELDCQAQIN